jgi:hypothetical protein
MDKTIEVKVKLTLCLTKHHAMKTYWGSGSIAPRILDLGTRWRWVVSFTTRPLYHRERAPGTHGIGWVGSWVVLDAVVKRKIPRPRWESNPRTPIVQPVAQCYTDWAMTALDKTIVSNELAQSCGTNRDISIPKTTLHVEVYCPKERREQGRPAPETSVRVGRE